MNSSNRKSTSLANQSKPFVTLKQKYDQKKRSIVLHTTLREHYVNKKLDALLVEAFNAEDFDKLLEQGKNIKEKMQSLRSLVEKPGTMPEIASALDEAEKELDNSMNTKSGKVDQKPLAKSMTFLEGIYSFFSKVPEIVKKGAKKDLSEFQENPVLPQLDASVQASIKSDAKKALRPKAEGGIFAKIMSLFKSIPYIKNVDALLKQVLEETPASALVALSQSSSQTLPQVQQDANNVTSVMQGKSEDVKTGGAQTSEQEPASKGEPIRSSQQLVVTLAAAEAQKKTQEPEKVQAAVDTALKNPQKIADKLTQDISQKTKVNADVVKKIIKALVDTGTMHSNVSIAESSSRAFAMLKLSDIIKVRDLLIEERVFNQKKFDDVLAAIEDGKVKDLEDLKNRMTVVGLKGQNTPKLPPAAKKALISKFLEKNPSEDKKKVQKAILQDSESKNSESDDKKVDSKHKKVLEKLKDAIEKKEFSQEDVVKVLEALPSWLMLENKIQKMMSVIG